MELRKYWEVIRRWMWLIAILTLAGAGAAYYVSSMMTPVYEAHAVLRINWGQSPQSDVYSSQLASQQMAASYAQEMETTLLLQKLINDLRLPMTVPQLQDMIRPRQIAGTSLIGVYVRDTNPARAATIANELVRAFTAQVEREQTARYQSSQASLDAEIKTLEQSMEKTQSTIAFMGVATDPYSKAELARLQAELSRQQTLYVILLNSAENFRLAAATYQNTLSLVSPAEVPTEPVEPRMLLNGVMGLGLGLALGLLCAFTLSYMDDTIKTEEDVRRITGLPTLGHIPRLPRSRKDSLLQTATSGGTVADAFRTLRVNIQFTSVDHPTNCLVITSCVPQEGKTLVVANLGAVMAKMDKTVVLVDGDLRRPGLHQLFDLPNEKGLSSLLVDRELDLEAQLRETSVPGLRVLTSGTLPPHPPDLLDSQRMLWLIAALKDKADMVLFDAPPLWPVSDARVLAQKVGKALLVIDVGKVRTDAALKAVQMLSMPGVEVLGVVLNREKVGGGYYYRRYYRNDKH